MLTAATIIARANLRAKVPNYLASTLDDLNTILSDLCTDYDLALARGEYNFNFNPALSSFFGSGPYTLPLDYLRTSGSSGSRGVTKSAFYLYPTPSLPQSQPIAMTPIDLSEFDLVPKVPAPSTPEWWCTDMGGPTTERIVLQTTAALTSGSTTATVADTSSLSTGLSMAGEAVVPGTTITVVNATTLTLSTAATKTVTAASVFFGIAPVAYVWPPPLGAYPVTVRYQRLMPPLTDTAQYPWFPHDGYLIDELAMRVMEVTDDTRTTEFEQRALRRLQKYLDLNDDKTNRAQQVQLDPRNFGGGTAYQRARKTKTAGW